MIEFILEKTAVSFSSGKTGELFASIDLPMDSNIDTEIEGIEGKDISFFVQYTEEDPIEFVRGGNSSDGTSISVDVAKTIATNTLTIKISGPSAKAGSAEFWITETVAESDDGKFTPEKAGTHTVSIYTETEDGSDSKPYIDEKLSKNVTYTDHPHNNWEEVLNKKGDPKTGYNTIEKIANASSEGGSSSGGSGINILHGEIIAGAHDPLVRITDAGPFNNTDEGYDEAVAFIADLATKQTFVVFNINEATFSWPVMEMLVSELTFICLGTSGSGEIKRVDFTLEPIDNLLYFAATLSN